MTRRGALSPALQAVRLFRRAFLLIQGMALLLVTAYFTIPGSERLAVQMAEVKARYGWVGAGVLAIIASVVLPELLRRVTGIQGASRRLIAFQLVFFFLLGVLINALYQGLESLYGGGHDIGTIVRKVASDQLFFTPFISIPFTVVAWRWYECGFSTYRLTATPLAWWRAQYPTVLIPAWAFWAPILFLVFALPGPLQFPMFIVMQAAWSLIVVHISQGRESAPA